MTWLLRVLTHGLFISAVYLKAIEIFDVNLYLFVDVLVFLATLARLALRPKLDRTLILQSQPIIWLTMFTVFVVFQYWVLRLPAQLDVVYLTIAILLTYILFLCGLAFGNVSPREILVSATITGVVSSILLLLQVHVSVPRFDVVALLARHDLARDEAARIPGYYEYLSRAGRGLANTTGEYVVHSFLPILFLTFELREITGWAKLLSFAGFILLVASIITAGSESFYWALGGAASLLLIARVKTRSLTTREAAIVGGAVAYLLVSLVLAFATSGLFPTGLPVLAPGSVRDRLFYWATALRMFLASPATGLGMGTFESLMEQYRPGSTLFNWSPRPALPHSILLLLLSGGGLIGVVLYFGFIMSSLRLSLAQTLKVRTDRSAKTLHASLLAILIYGFFGNIYQLLDLYLVAGLASYNWARTRLDFYRPSSSHSALMGGEVSGIVCRRGRR